MQKAGIGALAVAGLGLFVTACVTGNSEKEAVREIHGAPIQDARELGILPLPEGGEWHTGFWKGQSVEYYRHGGINYFDGDIIIPDGEIKSTLALSKESATGRTNGYWPNAEVPYVIDASANGFTANINAAIQHLRTRTPIVLVPRTSQGDYVRFRGASVNNSNVGRIGGEQIINLATNSMGVIVHEIGHAVGLWHEQARSDRDNHIEINWSNIRPAVQANFNIDPGFVLDGMDYGSIMIYPSFISDPNFVYNTSTWVMRRRADGSTWTAQRTALSTGDIRGMGRMYPGTAPIFRATNNDLIGGVIYGLLPEVTRFQTDGNRILALTSGGVLYGKDGLHGTWLNLLPGVQKFWFSGDNIAALGADGVLRGKVGLSGSWVNLRYGVKDVRVEGSRFVALGTDNVLYGKDGLNGTWLNLRPGVADFRLAGNRIATLGGDGVLWGKDGLSGTWVNLRPGVKALALAGNRIGALGTDGILWAKEGLSGTWVNLRGGVASFQLEGNRIGALGTDGTLYAKDGLSGTWYNQLPGVTEFYLSGNAISARAGNSLHSKAGLQGIWHFYAGNCAQFEQI